MSNFKLALFCTVGFVALSAVVAIRYQGEEPVGQERERDLDSIGGGHVLRGLDSLGEGNLLRSLYREKPRDFLRINRGLDSLSGATFGMAKRLDSLAGLGFGSQKRNFDEIDRSNFGTFKRNMDEIDRSDFDRFIKRQQFAKEENEQP